MLKSPSNMPLFIYKAKKGPVDILDGTIEAENLDSALDKITKLGYVPIDISLATAKEVKLPPKPKLPSFAFLSFHSFVNPAEVGLFTRQVADLVGAGVPLLRALRIISNQGKNPHFKEMIHQIETFVQDGGTFSQALSRHPQVFSPLYVNMVRAGEISGNLDTVLNRLADFSEKDLETRSKIRSSLAYPALIFIVGVITIFVLLTFVIPRITVMFEDLSETLPLLTLILMAVSNFLSRFWWLVFGLAYLLFFYFKRFCSSPSGKLKWDTLKLKIPLVGSFIRDSEMGRLARSLGTLLDGGVVIVSALDSVWAVLDNEALKGEVKKLSADVAGGDSLTAALKKCKYFPETAVNMVMVGEESGHLEQALYKIADAYERESDRMVKTVTSLLEPVMIIVVGSVVAFIVVAMLLPIFKMNLMIR